MSQAEEIIKENVALMDYQGNIIEMIDKREALITRYVALGFERENFFEESRKLACKLGRLEISGSLVKINGPKTMEG